MIDGSICRERQGVVPGIGTVLCIVFAAMLMGTSLSGRSDVGV